MAAHRELSPDELTNRCSPDQFFFETTADLSALEGTIGQERAVTSIQFGLGVETFGFNIYVAGHIGTGKNSTVLEFVNQRAKLEPTPPDWVYVYNFDDPLHPSSIKLVTGRAEEFSHDMDDVIDSMKAELPRAFESENYERRRAETMQEIQQRRDTIFTQLQQQAATLGFQIEMTPLGIVTVPMAEGKPFTRDEFESLSEADKDNVKQRSNQLEQTVNQVLTRTRQLEKEAQEQLKELDRETALFAVGHILEEMRNKYMACEADTECRAILDYLDNVQKDVLDHIDEFRQSERRQMQIPGMPPVAVDASDGAFDRYKVNVLVSNKETEGAPVVFENNPSYYNLMGKIEYKARFGFMTTDHNMIRAGAIERANGGYLVLQALDLLTNPFSWEALKRALRGKQVCIENIGEQYSLIPTATPKPEPIPIDVKVILVGSPHIYYLLYYMDEDFRKLFKVKADFDIEMDRTHHHMDQYARFICKQVQEQSLKHFDRSAVARVVDFGSRIIEDKNRLSTKFIEIIDIIAESSYWATTAEHEFVLAEDVDKAIEQKEYRSKMVEDKIQRLIEEGVIMIDTQGKAVGQANALSVYSLGDYMFGRPSKITCRTAIGHGGIIDIQRETEMGGPIHNKGVMILNGYLTGKYAQDKPLVLSATLAFEQLYEGVEGDSASSTELYTLLSSLSDLPINQELAITGSVNQKGEVQPIGGVNRKIEGFFEVCKALGFTGNQGVMIPIQNVRHLMLKDEVIDAVRKGTFHIYAVKTVDEGIEILTGVPAGERAPDGNYPEGTVHYLANRRLHEMASRVKEFGVQDGFTSPKKSERERASI